MTTAFASALLVLCCATWASTAAGAAVAVQIVDPSLEMTLEGEVEDMVWVGAKKDTVFVLTTHGKLYRSSDSGKHWVDEEPKLRSAVPYRHRTRDPIHLARIEVSQADRSHLVFVGTKDAHWSTLNSGSSYIAMGSNLLLHEMKMHPTSAGLILASTMSDKCHAPAGDPSTFCFKNLWLTHDGGVHWKFLTSYIVQFDWVHNLAKEQARGMPVDAIFASEFQTKVGAQRFGYWDADIAFVLSTDHFRSKRVLVPHGNRFLFTPKFLFVARVDARRPTEVSLSISRDAGRTWETADLPFALNQHSYTILDTSEDTGACVQSSSASRRCHFFSFPRHSCLAPLHQWRSVSSARPRPSLRASRRDCFPVHFHFRAPLRVSSLPLTRTGVPVPVPLSLSPR